MDGEKNSMINCWMDWRIILPSVNAILNVISNYYFEIEIDKLLQFLNLNCSENLIRKMILWVVLY